MIRECKIIRHGKTGTALLLPKAYIDLLELKAGNVAQLILDKENIDNKELIIRFTDRTQKQKDKE